MTRQDYVDYLDRLRPYRSTFEPDSYRRAVAIAADFFAADNSRFDRQRFIDYAYKERR